ncbi:MAG: beta-galactosidase [Nostoc sp.]|uniref:beta-galactosidase n=1 Tax=Nostoc sp. TaxID=1180 RepID=UPI002FF46021
MPSPISTNTIDLFFSGMFMRELRFIGLAFLGFAIKVLSSFLNFSTILSHGLSFLVCSVLTLNSASYSMDLAKSPENIITNSLNTKVEKASSDNLRGGTIAQQMTINNQPIIKNGDDWWLPSWVNPLPDVVSFNVPNPQVPFQTLDVVTLRWRDVNPQEGVYDWSILQKALGQTNNIYVRFLNSDVIHCPIWLSSKYPSLKPFNIGSYQDDFNITSAGFFYPMWHPEFQQEFKKLLQSFKAQNFASHPHLKFFYIPGAWQWGEFNPEVIQPLFVAEGLTPSSLLTWFRGLIDAYVDAFGTINAYKLVYTDQDILYNFNDAVDWEIAIDRNPSGYVVSKGGSTRFGLLAKYNFVATDMPNYGVSVVDIGTGKYMIVDDNAPLIADPKRIIGSETVQFGGSTIPLSSDPALVENQYRMTALKNLQLRVNVLMSTTAEYWNAQPALHTYMLNSLGKHYYDSPDAWADLREAEDVYQQGVHWNLGDHSKWTIRNLERWLIQREVAPDGNTVATNLVTLPVQYNKISYEARRTDHQNGSDYIYFGVDDKFIKGGTNNIQIKVTYLDNNSASWGIQYNAANGNSYKKSSLVSNTNNNQWKTATFAISDAAFINRQNGNMDFRIFNGGQQDLTVRFVRVIKLQPPS